MKRLQLFPIMLLVFFIMTGCTQINLNRTEIDRIFNTRIIAVDKTGPDKILFTISTKQAAREEDRSKQIPRSLRFWRQKALPFLKRPEL